MSATPRPLRPYVPATSSPPELTALAIGLGIVLSLAFGMVNAYLGLKVGITVSASIPSAVLSMTVRGTEELCNCLLGFGPWIRVLKPKSLRDEVAQLHREAARLYGRA